MDIFYCIKSNQEMVEEVKKSAYTTMVFDTETTGLCPKIQLNENWNEIDITLFPYIVQLSYVIIEETSQTINIVHDEFIKIPEHVIISDFVTQINGISNEQLLKKGRDLETELELVMINYIRSKKIVGHNLTFDITMLLVSIIRIIKQYESVDEEEYNKWVEYYDILYFGWKQKGFCTMKTNITLCNIWVNRSSGQGRYLKFPKLSELHFKLFSREVSGLHNSLIDVFVCLRCYYYTKYNIDLVKCNKTLKDLYSLIT
jgi:DNA polymerase III epsilon subunit-like protein